MSNIYEVLYDFGITIFNFQDEILKMSDDKLDEWLSKMCDEVTKDEFPQNLSYVYSTNSDYSGSRRVCSELSCRKKRLLELSKFAFLFSDTILIEFPLIFYMRDETTSLEERHMIIEDIELIYWMREFIDVGAFTYSVNVDHFCPNCYMKVLNTSENNRLIELKNEITRDLENTVDCVIEKDEYENVVLINGLSKISEHNQMCLILGNSRNELIKNMKTGQKLSKTMIRKLGVVDGYVNIIFNDLINSNWLRNEHNSKYVTNREFDIEILSKNNVYIKNSNMILKGIEHIAPNINKLSVQDLIDLRKEEYNSFLVYRDSIMKVINMSNINSATECKQAFDDEIRPKLNQLDLKIKKHTQRSKNKAILGTLTGVGIFGVGMATKIIPQDFYSQIITLGGVEILVNAGIKVANNLNPSYQEDELYFLWKLKNVKRS